MKSDQIDQLATALSKAQAEIKGAVKDATNPFFKSKYADLESVWEACRMPLSKNGLSIVQAPQIGMSTAGMGACTELVTILLHASGQWIESRYPINPIKNDPQGLGAAITYARRYALASVVGVCSIEDDDGETAMNRNSFNKKEMPKAKLPNMPEEIKGRFLGMPPIDNVDLGDYIVPVTDKLIGKSLKDIPLADLQGILNWYLDKKTEGRTFGSKHQEFIEYATKYLGTKQKQDAAEENIPF